MITSVTRHQTHARIHAHTNTCTCARTRTHEYMYMHTHVWMHTCIYAHYTLLVQCCVTHLCMCVCVCVRGWTRTHIHVCKVNATLHNNTQGTKHSKTASPTFKMFRSTFSLSHWLLRLRGDWAALGDDHLPGRDQDVGARHFPAYERKS